MRVSRFLAVLGVGALVIASVTPAAAAEPGVGTTTGTLGVVDLDAGDLLTLDLLQDLGLANTDPDVAEPSARATLSALGITSAATGLDEQIDVLQVESTGEEQSASEGVRPVSNPVLDGSLLPVDLSALVGDEGAVANIGAGVADLDVLSGVLSVDATELSLGSTAGATDATGTRSLGLDAVSVLDLDELLAGLGISLGDLSLDTVLALVNELGLLGQLGAALADLGVPLDLENLSPESLQTAVTLLGTQADTLAATGEELCVEATDPILGQSGIPFGLDAEQVCSDLTSVITQLDDLLGNALDTTLSLLEGAALISLDGLQVGMTTVATDSLDSSVAEVVASLDGLRVGTLEVPSVDLVETVESVEGQLDAILGTISPALAGLIDIGLLEEATDVVEDENTITSTASFTGLRLEIGDLADDVLDGLLGDQEGSIGDTLTELGLGDALPVAALEQINVLLTDAVGPVTALADGLTLRVGALDQTSAFTEVLSNTATPATPELPRTGSNDTAILLGAALAAAGALGLRFIVRRAR